MVKNLKVAFHARLQNLTWMENATKVKALEKLETMDVQVGYPEEWQNYSLLEIKNDSYVMNVLRAGRIQFNHGAIGAIIGHEMTHGFDDQGRKFDKNGNMTDWWTEQDGSNFNNSTKMLIGQYANFEALPGLFVNGNLTLGENIADMGGLTMAYYAYHLAEPLEPKKIDGFAADQRFFLGNAQMWRESFRNESLRTQVLTNEHSPSRFRINGVVFNMPEFYRAFSEVKPGDKLFRQEEERPVIW